MSIKGIKFEIDLVSLGFDDVVFRCLVRVGDTYYAEELRYRIDHILVAGYLEALFKDIAVRFRSEVQKQMEGKLK